MSYRIAAIDVLPSPVLLRRERVTWSDFFAGYSTEVRFEFL
jgi:hypothetical protein